MYAVLQSLLIKLRKTTPSSEAAALAIEPVPAVAGHVMESAIGVNRGSSYFLIVY
jgi:hypothetical protein